MATKKSKAAAKKSTANGHLEVPALFGLALLLALLCILPWLGGLTGSVSLQALQLSMALLLALAGGACLGFVWAGKKK